MIRDRNGRLVLAGAVALITALMVLDLAARPNVTMDFTVLWQAARLWVTGRDPYALRPCCLFYPLPALMVVWPVHWLSHAVAAMVFVAVPAGLLAWRLSRDALWPLLALASPNFVMAIVLGQWTPWLVLAIFWPALGFLLASKPTLGLACFAARPTWRGVLSGAAILLLSLLLMPRWPAEWLHNLNAVSEHPAPIATPAGGILLLALLRWRRTDARLLVVMSCVPQLLLFADQLPLMFVARSRREAALLAIGGWLAAGFWFVRESTKFGAVPFAAPYVMAGCYLPALWIVLRHPNEGAIPAWLERRIASWPSWLRGVPSATLVSPT